MVKGHTALTLWQKWCRNAVCILGILMLGAFIQGCGDEEAANNVPLSGREDGHWLDAANRTAIRPVPRGLAAPGTVKFIEVHITEVVNPEKIPLVFEVRWRGGEGGEIFLGSFSPFPPDNPGTFIVGTAGKLRSEGEITLTMTFPNGVRAGAPLKVHVGTISFRRE